MATDYILFIHGVNTRPDHKRFIYAREDDFKTRPTPKQSSFAQDLIRLIEHCNQTSKSPLNIKPVPLNWYELMLDAEQQLLNWFCASSAWDKFWFKEFRQTQILPFTGDAALYLSRYIGSDVVDKLKDEAKTALQGCNPQQDRLHLVTHSWGTVVFFDILFAGRWDDPDIPGYASAQAIRRQLFGIDPQPNQGIRLASIHTLGSPIALANLINVKRLKEKPGQELTEGQIKTIFTHDITYGLEKLLKNLYEQRQKKLSWRNFAHPGDPIAYPLGSVIPKLIDGQRRYLDIQDILTRGSGPLEWLARLLSWSFLALVNGGSAHGSYWKNKKVAQAIVKTIQQSSQT